MVTCPDVIDLAGSRRLCGELGSALASAGLVVVDMTATRYCDSSGVELLLLAQEQATATGVKLAVVVPSASVLRTMSLMGADWLLPVYPRLKDALRAWTGAAAGGCPPLSPDGEGEGGA